MEPRTTSPGLRQPWLFVARGQLSDRLSADTFAEIPASPGVYRFYDEEDRAYVGQILCPSLRAGDVVVMDNLAPHKNEHTLALIRQAGAKVLFLPPYSPDLNPIEKMWSKVKAYLRSTEAHTAEDLFEAIGKALQSVTPSDARGWFACCGYSFI